MKSKNNKKTCSQCFQKKSIKEFYKDKYTKDGLHSQCKTCIKQYYFENKDKITLRAKQYKLDHKDEIKLQTKRYNLEHKEEKKLKSKQDHQKNKEKINLRHRQHYSKNKDKILVRHRGYERNKRKTDTIFRIKKNLRCRINCALKDQGIKKTLHMIESLGCTAEFYQNYLKSLFKPGMTLANCGKRKWHQHHPKKISSFDLSKVEEQKKAFHYTNVVPMWEDEHREWHRTHPN